MSTPTNEPATTRTASGDGHRLQTRTATDSPDRLPAAVYVLGSKRESEETSADNQIAACRDRAERLGWDVVAVYADSDTSFTSRPRAAYTSLVRDIRAGDVCGVIAWSLDRLIADDADLLELLSLASQTGLRVDVVKMEATR